MLESEFPVVPGKMALINVDLQNLFVEGYPLSAPDGLELLDRINHLSNVCRNAGILVIHAMHVRQMINAVEQLQPVRRNLDFFLGHAAEGESRGSV